MMKGGDDLSTRSRIFRSKLIDEFRLNDSSLDQGPGELPTFSTKDMEAEPDRFKRILRDMPSQLIKFKIFKRSQFRGVAKQKDKRLTRIKNINSVPVGVWSAWLTENQYYTWLINFTILLNAVLLALQAEMSAEAYPLANQVFDVIDLIILLSFASEILLKWLDSFTKFWSNRWNTFDFVITLLSALPNIVYLFASDNPAQSRQLKGIARDLRILRTLRTFKAIARFGSLQIIVKTILDAFSSMTFIMLTLLLVTYIVAVLGIQLFAEYTNSTRTDLLYKDYFKSVLRSGMTLFQLLTLDNWYQIQREIGTVVNPAITSIYFIFWVWIGAFIFRNIFIGVMVKNFQILSERLAAEEEEAKKKKKLERLSQQLHKNLSLQSSALRTRGGAAAAGAGDPSRVGPKENAADWAALAAGVVSDEPIDESDLKRAPVTRRDSRGNIRPLPQPRADSRASSRQMLVRPMTGPGGTRDSPVLTGLNMMLVGSADGWDADLARGMKAIAASKQEIRWPRDTLFKYFQVMESMQENQMEYYQLQMLLTSALNAIHDE